MNDELEVAVAFFRSRGYDVESARALAHRERQLREMTGSGEYQIVWLADSDEPGAAAVQLRERHTCPECGHQFYKPVDELGGVRLEGDEAEQAAFRREAEAQLTFI